MSLRAESAERGISDEADWFIVAEEDPSPGSG